MGDNPYELDPFTQVVNVQFGSGKYLALTGYLQAIGGGGGPTSGHVEATFPSIAGGTPGLSLIDSGVPFPGSIPGPVRLNGKQIAGKPLLTLAGASFSGFSVSGQDTVSASATVWLPIKGILQQRFGLRIFLQAGGNVVDAFINIGLYSRGLVKAGVLYNSSTLGNGVTTPVATVSGGTQTNSPFEVQANFTVDPDAMTVEQTS